MYNDKFIAALYNAQGHRALCWSGEVNALEIFVHVLHAHKKMRNTPAKKSLEAQLPHNDVYIHFAGAPVLRTRRKVGGAA